MDSTAGTSKLSQIPARATQWIWTAHGYTELIDAAERAMKVLVEELYFQARELPASGDNFPIA
jgi:hypothetical protein